MGVGEVRQHTTLYQFSLPTAGEEKEEGATGGRSGGGIEGVTSMVVTTEVERTDVCLAVARRFFKFFAVISSA